MADDLNFQNISSVANKLQPTPTRIVAADTIAPSTFLTFVSGTTPVKDITPPVTGAHLLALIFTDATPGTTLTTGNILGGAITPTQNVPVFLVYDPVTAGYYGGEVKLT